MKIDKYSEMQDISFTIRVIYATFAKTNPTDPL